MVPHRAVFFFWLTASWAAGTGAALSEDRVALPADAFGDMLVSGSIGDARNLLPPMASDGASAEIVSLVYNGLTKYDRDLRLVGDLAERWEVSADGLVITFTLRPGVRWQDGHPFTAEDVAFTYRTFIDPAVPTPYASAFEQIERVEVTDPLTVRVIYREPFAPALENWGFGVMPQHLLATESFTNTRYARSPVGTGPYRFVRWKTAQVIELRANENYFEGRPAIARNLTRVIPDPDTMFLELRTRGLDWMGLTPLQFERQAVGPWFEARFQRFRYPSFGYTYLGYNLADPRFADHRVRQALNAAIDKQEIIDGVLLGLGTVSTGPYPPQSWAFNPAVAATRSDPARARALLAEAGWADHDGDGWLDRDGVRFSFTLLTNQGNDTRQLVSEIVQRRLREFGIEVQIRVIEWSAFLTKFIDARAFDAVLLGWSLSQDPDLYDLWHSSKIPPPGFNFLGYRNDEVDRLLEAGRRTFDQGARQAIYRQVHAIVYEDQPCLFLFVPDSLQMLDSRVHGIDPAPSGIGHNRIWWYVPAPMHRYAP